MMRYSSVLLFISTLLQTFNLIHSSTKIHKHSKELDSYDEESSDKTIDVSVRDDSSQESAPESVEDNRNNRKRSVGRYNILDNLESRLEGNLHFILF